MKNNILNSKKPVGGVCASQDWSQKIPLKKSKMFYERNVLRKHPQIAKKWVQSLKNTNSQICSLNFFQRGQFLLKGFQQNSMKIESESDILPRNGHDSS